MEVKGLRIGNYRLTNKSKRKINSALNTSFLNIIFFLLLFISSCFNESKPKQLKNDIVKIDLSKNVISLIEKYIVQNDIPENCVVFVFFRKNFITIYAGKNLPPTEYFKIQGFRTIKKHLILFDLDNKFLKNIVIENKYLNSQMSIFDSPQWNVAIENDKFVFY